MSTSTRLKEYNKIFELIRIVIEPCLKGVVGPDKLKYLNFAKELCKTFNVDELISEYVKKSADREMLKSIAEKRDSICNALKSEESAQHKTLKKLGMKYAKPYSRCA